MGPLLLLLLGCLSGCAAALESGGVQQRFKTVFACPTTSRPIREAGGYRVEGCGNVAHFRCFSTRSRASYPSYYSHYHQPGAGRPSAGAVLAAAAFAAIADGALRQQNCLLEYARPVGPPLRAQVPEDQVAASLKKGVVRARTLVDAGTLTLFGKPAAYPDKVLVGLSSPAGFAPAPCAARLYNDGTPIPVEQVQRVSDHLVRLVIPVEALRNAEQSVRVAATVCGQTFALNEQGRKVAGLFEARFREELARQEQERAQGEAGNPSSPEPLTP